MGIFEMLDSRGALPSVVFVAVKLDNLPKFGPEEINVAYVVDRQVRMEATINDIANTVQSLTSNIRTTADDIGEDAGSSSSMVQSTELELTRRFDTFQSMVVARLDQINSALPASIGARDRSMHVDNTKQSADADRQHNVVIFGVPENRDASVWRHNIDDILHFVLEHSVDTVDMFRLGRFNANSSRPRPILVKLRAVWDKRLLLSKRNKLKNYSVRGVFIDPDEPSDVRRARILDRMKTKAERDGKSVRVADGVLFIDDVDVFHINQGLQNVYNA